MIYVCSLIDEHSSILEGKIVLKTLQEVYRVLPLNDTQEIIFQDAFIERYFTPSGFVDFVKESKLLNKFVDLTYSDKFVSYFQERALALKGLRNYEELIDYIMTYKEEALKEVHHLCDHYATVNREALVANNKLSTMHLELSEVKALAHREEEAHAVTRDLLTRTNLKLSTLVSRINNKHGIDVDPDKMDGIRVKNNRYTKVLYVKEITRVVYVDTLLYYLQEVLKTLQGVPTRFMVIEPQGANGKYYMYPNCKHYTSLTYNDIFNSDIFMAGFQPNIVESVLKNPSNVEYLIILDRSGADKPYVSGNGVEVIYTASDLKDVKANVPLSRTISYSKETLHVPFIKDFNELPMEVRIGKYSSMPSTKALVELLQRRS